MISAQVCTWLKSTHNETMTLIKQFLQERAVTPEQRKMFLLAFDHYCERIPVAGNGSNLSLPRLIYMSTSQYEERNADSLAMICNLISIGIYLLDDIADNELSERWIDISPEVIHLVACDILYSLTQYAIAELPVNADIKVNLSRTLMSYYLKISAGQQYEIANRNVMLKEEAVLRTIKNKSGMCGALYAALAVCLGEGYVCENNLYVEFACALSVAKQIGNDLYDLFFKKSSNDLMNGTQTLPLVMYINATHGAEKLAFIAMLKEARHSEEARVNIRNILLNSDWLNFSIFILSSYIKNAYKLLEQLSVNAFIKEALLLKIKDAEF
jgi:geranylgeranyl pyrophosphate synthase